MITEQDIRGAWPGIRPESVIPVNRGNNNLTYRVGSPQGEFVLQVMLNVRDRGCLAAKHRLLGVLRDLDPGFAVPTPLPGIDGSTFVSLDGASLRLGVLVPMIPGTHPDAYNMEHVAASATALGKLHLACARISEPRRFTCGVQVSAFTPGSTPFGGPEAMIEAVGLPASTTSALIGVVSQLRMMLATMDASLPVQLLHADFYPSNVLIVDSTVSGVLDFEFVSIGPRTYDVALGLWAFTLWDAWLHDDQSAWHRAEVFLAAYAETVSLASLEWQHLADYIVVQEVHSLLHWCGRCLGGLASRADLNVRTQRLIDMDRWVKQHRERLDALASRG